MSETKLRMIEDAAHCFTSDDAISALHQYLRKRSERAREYNQHTIKHLAPLYLVNLFTYTKGEIIIDLCELANTYDPLLDIKDIRTEVKIFLELFKTESINWSKSAYFESTLPNEIQAFIQLRK